MPTPVETILTTVGLPAEDVTKISALTEEELKTFDPKPYIDKVKHNYQTQLQNDPAFFSELTLEKLPPSVKKTIESGQYARATNEAKAKIAKALGFSTEDIKEFETDDFKALDFYIPAIADKWTKSKASDPKIQQELITARKKLEDLEGLEDKVKVKYETEANQKVTSAIFNAALIGELSAIQGLKIPASDIAATANQILQSKYGFQRVGDYGIELRQKENPAMKVLKNNSSHELTLKEALQEIATERGWIEAKTEPTKGSGITITPNGKGELKMVASPHIQDKINAKIAAEK